MYKKKNKEMGELGGRYIEFVSLYSRSEYAFSTPDEIIFLGCISRKITQFMSLSSLEYTEVLSLIFHRGSSNSSNS